MTRPGEEASVTSDFVRSYVITGGRTLPAGDQLALQTLVTIAPERTLPLGASPEVKAIWELLGGGYLSVAEVAAHVALPVGVARLLLTDLLDQGHLLRRAEPPRAQNVERDTLEKVLNGLQSLIG
ncbi:DUF742 domain-containing protein [Streptomyces sp. CHA1]|jgi:hypothetical protein|uniref:DUF742 domain-containing protein n=5 Tax=Streptomyces TaxID=1883 RepID=A0ACC7Y227_9ACTN|nr:MULTISPECIES: DUF742 domain-containing protein [Streptomyces]KIX77133.1 hypothetical protein SF12_15280 [Streptomyces sp. MBRL 601]MBZ2408281.1 DUF742 domain-containing protein [Streptomyces sp. L06]MYQ72458.1 DUF742 domain-containing protein [Streptomyces sp. SID4934]MYW61149.1 DUF742 domain-containing protein [Streptomyces sp. SID8370]MYW87096.1 DUF742 domain-containing protein [Streptomyces sp. SID8371]MYX48268.1 DUF742 domain-containing protein [Streptomyces sp. SID8385]MYX85483.1 DUF